MSNLRITWALPNVSNRQRPIKHVLIEGRVSDELPWSEINIVPVDQPQELLIENIDPGDWQFRAIVVDEADQRGSPVEGSISIPFDPPGEVGDFALTLE